MTKIFNDPSEFSDDQLAGFIDLYADRLRQVPGGVAVSYTHLTLPTILLV